MSAEISIIAIQLCFVTLQRPNEIVKAHRDDFHFKENVWRIHPDRNKTDQWYEVPLSELAVEIAESDDAGVQRVLRKAYEGKLLGNARVARFLTQNHAELLPELRKIAQLESSAA